MNVTIWSVVDGPWPGQHGPDTDGFRSAVDILHVIDRRMRSGEANADDRTRYRIAAATIERGARRRGMARARVDGDDLLAWLDGEPIGTVFLPSEVNAVRVRIAVALEGSGALSNAVVTALDAAVADLAGVVLTMEPQDGSARVTAPTRPSRPAAARTILPDPDLAAQIGELPLTADVAFEGDRLRLASADTLRRQIRSAIERGEPLSVGSQAKHEVLTEVIRELHHPTAPKGAVRLMYATEGEEGQPLHFGPLPEPISLDKRAERSVHLAMMSMRHTKLDSLVDGYWFRNRLVSVAGQSQAAAAAYCHRDTRDRLHRLVERGVTDLYITHTGFEPAALGFYRAVAEVAAEKPIRIHPRYYIRRSIVHGTNWPGGIDT